MVPRHYESIEFQCTSVHKTRTFIHNQREIKSVHSFYIDEAGLYICPCDCDCQLTKPKGEYTEDPYLHLYSEKWSRAHLTVNAPIVDSTVFWREHQLVLFHGIYR